MKIGWNANIMINRVTATEEVIKVTDVICDICGKSCIDKLGGLNYAQITANWGYGSSRDGEVWEAQICEVCSVDKLRSLINFEITRLF